MGSIRRRREAALGGSRSAGTPGFFQMIHAARRLQFAGELNVELRNENGANRVYIVVAVPHDSEEPPNAAADRRLLRQRLRLPRDTGSFEVVYGPHTGLHATISIRNTRSPWCRI